MQPRNILGLAARHYVILDILENRTCDYSELVKATKISRSTLGNYIKKMIKAGLVEENEEGSKYILRITENGKITLEYINRYERLLFKPTRNDTLQNIIDEIIDYYEMDHKIRRIEEIFSKRLFELCRANPEAIFYSKTQNFFEDYIGRLALIPEINDIIFWYIKYIMQNLELRDWFYGRIYPILIKQFKDNETADQIRTSRVPFLWEIFVLDESIRDEILNIFIAVLENECKGQERELCRYIYGSYPPIIQEEIIRRLLKFKDKKEILGRFFHSN